MAPALFQSWALVNEFLLLFALYRLNNMAVLATMAATSQQQLRFKGGKKGKKSSGKGGGGAKLGRPTFETERCPVPLDALQDKYHGQLQHLLNEYATIRTGEVTPNLLDGVKVKMGDATFALSQAGMVSVKNTDTLIVTTFDSDTAKAAYEAVVDANIAPNPVRDDLVIRIQMPKLTKEYREQVVKRAKEMLEQTKNKMRHLRSHAVSQLKGTEGLSEDDTHAMQEYLDAINTHFVAQADEMYEKKADHISNPQ
ncbi:uncharacterized protein MONBRDRAFT_31871 [Monosiga brevicollis MX1]|uniref:Ribosome recycling factor domain-containing protein n=1 Tax=Monosiga brevicollis TaxID=81824 RepID=A9UVX4_MONBE|nr:uncharacterized protein MONBRDRAFT_31871 [Monosiga brevicollis MX1]EDQ90466.1 predicted protein [Monosiga brevicollis MX1]|eukprot:XP_001744517.1 hypothetical protein [Monosiga brevicollis MX1]